MGNATFIFSLDCEGKWGAADLLESSVLGSYTSAGLEEAYRRLVELLDKYEVPATFAFSSCFYLTADEVNAHPQWFEPSDFNGRDWFKPFKSDLAKQQFDGWLSPKALEIVMKSSAHEIASHGFSHIPLGDTLISERQFRREMECIRAAEALRGIKTETFVFPRNKIGYLSALSEYGFTAYRPPDPGNLNKTAGAKLVRLANDFNLFEKPVDHSDSGEPLALPAGRYLTLRNGFRRWIPTAAIKTKIESVLDRTIRNGQVCHLFSHPHNFITGWRQYDVLEVILQAVAERVRAGELTVQTQQEYCRHYAPAPMHQPLPEGALAAGI